VYKLLKHMIENDATKEYDDSFLCQAFSNFLSECARLKLKDPKMPKLVRVIVIFLLKMKSFHTSPAIKQSVLRLTVSLCRLFPLSESQPPLD